MVPTRREFLERSAAALGAAYALPPLAGCARPAAPPTQAATNDHVLVIIELSGGNDGLSTVIPVDNDDYVRARPQLALRRNLLYLGADAPVALHPQLPALKELFDAGQLAILPAVGYPDSSRAHYRAMEIWHTGEPAKILPTGWLGRCGDRLIPDPQWAIQVGQAPELALQGAAFRALNIRATAPRYHGDLAYPDHPFAQHVQTVAQQIATGSAARVYYVSLGGFDTHARQKVLHERLLGVLSGSLGNLWRNLHQNGQDLRTVVLVFSEFGRSLAENSAGGTDHGAAGPVFLAGPAVRGGLLGPIPSLRPDALDRGAPRHSTDFRSVYATLLERWLEIDSRAILGPHWSTLPII